MQTNLAYQSEEESWDELIGGKLVTLSPRPMVNHNFVAGNIYIIFANYLHGKNYTPFVCGTDLYLEEGERYVPDCMVVCDRNKIRANGVHGAPDLVVEVLSPSTAARDKSHKKRVYERCGVREYWIVSPVERSVEQYVLEEGQFVLRDVYSIYPEAYLEKFTPEEQARIPREFRCSLFDDLVIRLEDVFYNLI